MPNVTLTWTGTDKLRRALKKYGEAGVRAAAGALYREGEKIVTAAKREAPVGVSNALRASGHVQAPVLTRAGVSVTLGFGGAAAPYAVYVHEGIGPAVGEPAFMPPSDAFKAWARKKLGDEKLAFVVARAVGRRGLAPTKFLERPFRKAENRMAARIGRDMRAQLGG